MLQEALLSYAFSQNSQPLRYNLVSNSSRHSKTRKRSFLKKPERQGEFILGAFLVKRLLRRMKNEVTDYFGQEA